MHLKRLYINGNCEIKSYLLGHHLNNIEMFGTENERLFRVPYNSLFAPFQPKFSENFEWNSTYKCGVGYSALNIRQSLFLYIYTITNEESTEECLSSGGSCTI